VANSKCFRNVLVKPVKQASAFLSYGGGTTGYRRV
jgi:hypothetical protein